MNGSLKSEDLSFKYLYILLVTSIIVGDNKMIDSVVVSVIGTMILAGSMYFKKYMSTTTPEEFDYIKFLTTMVIAVIVGIVAGQYGLVVTEQYLAAQMATYAGLSIFIENLIKTIYRWAQQKGYL